MNASKNSEWIVDKTESYSPDKATGLEEGNLTSNPLYSASCSILLWV